MNNEDARDIRTFKREIQKAERLISIFEGRADVWIEVFDGNENIHIHISNPFFIDGLKATIEKYRAYLQRLESKAN